MLPLDATALALFLVSAFVGGVIAGLAGFAMGLVVSGIWLHVLTPVQTAALIVGYGIFGQSYNVWRFRHAMDLRRVLPLIAGGALGVPLGIWLLARLDPVYVRRTVGALLVLYSLYGMVRPKLAGLRADITADGAVGFVNGVLGGLTGLAGPIAVIWCQISGVPHARQRAIFQPVIFAMFAMTAIGLGLGGGIDADVLKLFALGFVPVMGGMRLGVHLYGRLDEEGFRRAILVLLFVSGLVLLVPGLR